MWWQKSCLAQFYNCNYIAKDLVTGAGNPKYIIFLSPTISMLQKRSRRTKIDIKCFTNRNKSFTRVDFWGNEMSTLTLLILLTCSSQFISPCVRCSLINNHLDQPSPCKATTTDSFLYQFISWAIFDWLVRVIYVSCSRDQPVIWTFACHILNIYPVLPKIFEIQKYLCDRLLNFFCLVSILITTDCTLHSWLPCSDMNERDDTMSVKQPIRAWNLWQLTNRRLSFCHVVPFWWRQSKSGHSQYKLTIIPPPAPSPHQHETEVIPKFISKPTFYPPYHISPHTFA